MTDRVRLDIPGISDVNLKAFSASSKKREEDAGGVSFSDLLKQSIVKVNDVQKNADTLAQRLALGEVDDVSEVSIAVEKAELALRMMVQIRDKLVDAYQQIARMSV